MASSELHACKQTAHSLSRPQTRFLVRAMEAAGERLQSKFGKTSSCHFQQAGHTYSGHRLAAIAALPLPQHMQSDAGPPTCRQSSVSRQARACRVLS